MNGKWIEVFKAGRQTSSAGDTREWTEADLDRIVANYNGQADHEAPVVVGHPEHNSPAFGWVESLKREGKVLYAKLKDVLPEFAEAVKQRTYRNRSISLYPDLTLRHIGFLGGMPPAVKGLADIAFRDKGEAITIEFSDWRMSTLGRIVMRIRDYLVEKEGADKADGIISSWEVQDLLNEPPEQEPIKLQYHEEESMKPEEVQAIVDKAVSGVTQQFSEALKGATDAVTALQTEVTGLKSNLEAEQAAGRRREFAEFLNTPEMQTRIPEAQRTATLNHMMTLVSADPMEFGEGDQKQSISAVDAYKKQLRALPQVVEFSEVATREKGAATATTMNRTEFSVLPADKQMEFVQGGGTVID